MPLRIAVGGFLHETNTFVDMPTTWADFTRDGAWPAAKMGAELIPTLEGLNMGLPGFVAEARKHGHSFLPLIWGMAQPSGIVVREAFERMAGHILDGLKGEKVDAVFLELHGAMVAEGFDDAEAELLRRVRALVGPDIPILGTLDLHANVSRPLVETANLLTSYRTYPHVDWGETGARAARWLDRVMSWGPNPARAFRQPPFLIPITTGCTLIEPSKGLYELLEKIEAETGVALSLNMGFPPADIPDVGPSILAYGADQATVDAAADRLFAALLAAEPEFAAHAPLQVKDAVSAAIALSANASKPVILADTQDNPGAGGPSNTTGLIKELLAQKAEGALVGIVHDPQAAAAAHAAGQGGTVAKLGGGGPGPGQEPVEGPWIVTALSDGRFAGTSPMLRSKFAEMGPTAILKRDGVEVLVATVRQQPIHRETFSHLGVDPRSRPILGLKSSAHFRAGYQEIAEKVIVALSPGVNLEDASAYSFEKIRPGVRLKPQPVT